MPLPTPEPLVIAALAGAGFLAGLVDAVAGGGGLVTLPALLAAGLPPHLALGSNKGQSVFGSGAALVAFARRGHVDLGRARLTFPLGFLGSLAGAVAVLAVSPAVLRPVILVLLPSVALFLVFRRPLASPAPGERPAPALPAARLARRAALIALVVGAYDGFFGPGTGTFLVLGFALFLGTPLVAASADAKVVNFASNLAALALFAWRGTIVWPVALAMGAGQLLGGWTGAHLAVRGGEKLVRAALLVVVVALVVKLTVDLLR